MTGSLRKISNVGQHVHHCTDTQSKGTGNLQCTNRISDFVKYVVDVVPSCVCIQDFERCCSVLGITREDELDQVYQDKQGNKQERTSLLLWELPAKASWKFA